MVNAKVLRFHFQSQAAAFLHEKEAPARLKHAM